MQVGGGGSLRSDINVTPLVDVVLVLLIIFMVITPVVQMGYLVRVPPKARSYFDLHATLDVKHSISWNAEAIAPAIDQDPRRARAIAEGALIRLNCGCLRPVCRELIRTSFSNRSSASARRPTACPRFGCMRGRTGYWRSWTE